MKMINNIFYQQYFEVVLTFAFRNDYPSGLGWDEIDFQIWLQLYIAQNTSANQSALLDLAKSG